MRGAGVRGAASPAAGHPSGFTPSCPLPPCAHPSPKAKTRVRGLRAARSSPAWSVTQSPCPACWGLFVEFLNGLRGRGAGCLCPGLRCSCVYPPTSPCQAGADAEDTAGRRARPWGPSCGSGIHIPPALHSTPAGHGSCHVPIGACQGRCQAWNPGRGSPLRSSPPEGVPGPEVVLLLEAPLCPKPCREAGWSPASSLLAHSLSRRLSGPPGAAPSPPGSSPPPRAQPHVLETTAAPASWQGTGVGPGDRGRTPG